MKVYGQLEKAQAENTTSDTGSLPKGMITYRTDLNVLKVSNGTSMLAMIDESTAQTMTNKTLTSPILTGPQITSGGALFTQIATPSTPSSGVNKLYFKSDGQLYSLGSDGIEQQIGSGGGGGTGKNYLSNINNVNGNGNFELGATTKWSLFNTTLTSLIPTGAINSGAASITTFAATTSGKLAGTYSLSVASTGAITAGHGFITDAFTIDTEDQAKVMSFKASYSVVSGASNLNFSGTSANTFAVYIYDVTNSVWIQPAGVYGMTQNSGVGSVQGTFQTSSNGTQYRLAVICINASAGASSLLFDSFQMGPQTIVQGTPVTDWTSFTPTGSWVSNATYTGMYRRVGGDAEFYVRVAATGAPTATSLSLTLPFGWQIDTTKILDTAQNSLGWFRGLDAGTGAFFGAISYISATTVGVTYANVTSANNADTLAGVTQAAPMTVASGDTFMCYFKVPIVGFSSNVQMSNDTDTRVVAFHADDETGYTQTTQASNTDFSFAAGDVTIDTHGAFNPATQVWTCPVSGIYDLYMQGSVNSGTGTNRPYILRPLINGVTKNLNFSVVPTGTSNSCSGTMQLNLKAGDTVKPQALYDAAGTFTISNCRFSMVRRSGPSVIAASETVAAIYEHAATTSISNSTEQTIAWDTRVHDSHLAMSGAGVYTVPVSGLYEVEMMIGYSTNTSGLRYLVISQTGSATKDYRVVQSVAEQSGITLINGTALLKCRAGDTITGKAFQNSGGALNTTGSTNQNTISIKRIGNA